MAEVFYRITKNGDNYKLVFKPKVADPSTTDDDGFNIFGKIYGRKRDLVQALYDRCLVEGGNFEFDPKYFDSSRKDEKEELEMMIRTYLLKMGAKLQM